MSFLNFAILLMLHMITCQSNDTPVIGILSLPCLPEVMEKDCPEWAVPSATSYIAASYVKWLEAGGARVVPIVVTDNLQSVSELVLQLNGILFTGGTEYFDSTSIYYNQVLNILHTLRKYHTENALKSIPLWGTCLGFQAMVEAIAKASIMKTGYDDHDVESVYLNPDWDVQNQKIFGSTMPYLYQTMVQDILSEKVTWNAHNQGFDPQDFVNDEYLNGNFSLIGTSIANKNKKHFVSLIESKGKHDESLSWYGSQFHPEKPQYEFAKVGVHNLYSIMANQYFSEFFVNECRIRNDIVMDEKILNNLIIYNRNPYFVNKYDGSSFEQNYIFTETKPSSSSSSSSTNSIL